MGAERRKHIRAKRTLTIEHRLIRRRTTPVDGSWHFSVTANMSITGLLFLSDIPYCIGDILEMHVVMSGALDVFNGFGRVVRVELKKDGYFVAIAFVERNSKYLKHLRTKKQTLA